MSNQHDISMAISNPLVNRSWPSEPAQHSARFTSLRIRVLNVETFIRLLGESTLHNNSVMSVDEDIGIHDMPIQDLSMQSLTSNENGRSDESMASAESLMDTESTDGNNQN